ncbi:MAG: efflux transporter outer membrane subunit [Mariniblastus sp.]|nr:efflux transporter outer membrane subunit [Mariniblastus sp.]
MAGPNNRAFVTAVSALMWTFMGSVLLTGTGCHSLQQWYDNGFKVGPNYRRPPAAVSDVWLEASDPKVSLDDSDFANWWSVFDDPVLDGLIQNAYQQNLTLREAGFRVLQARAERAIAAGELLPQAQQLSGEYLRINTSAQLPPPFNGGTFDEWSSSFNAAWELDIWGHFRRMVEAADAQLDASVNSFDSILTSLIADVAATYIEIRTAQQQLEYTRANVTIQEKSLELVQTQLELGATSEISVEYARANLEETRALIPALEINLRKASNRLCVLLGVPPRELGPILGYGDLPTVPSDIAVGIPADLIRRRPDIRAAERLVAARCAEVGVAESEIFPSFFINGSIKVSTLQNGGLAGNGSNGGIGPGFQWNILNYGRLLNNIRANEAVLEQAVSDYQQTVLEAGEEVENGLYGFLKTQEQTEALEASVKANQRALDLVNIQFKEGEVDFSPVFVLQSTVVQQQNELVQSQASIALNLIALYKALGGGWEIRCLLDQKCGVITNGFEGLAPSTDGGVPNLNQPETLEETVPQGAPNDIPLNDPTTGLSDEDIQRVANALLQRLTSTVKTQSSELPASIPSPQDGAQKKTTHERLSDQTKSSLGR